MSAFASGSVLFRGWLKASWSWLRQWPYWYCKLKLLYIYIHRKLLSLKWVNLKKEITVLQSTEHLRYSGQMVPRFRGTTPLCFCCIVGSIRFTRCHNNFLTACDIQCQLWVQQIKNRTRQRETGCCVVSPCQWSMSCFFFTSYLPVFHGFFILCWDDLKKKIFSKWCLLLWSSLYFYISHLPEAPQSTSFWKHPWKMLSWPTFYDLQVISPAGEEVSLNNHKASFLSFRYHCSNVSNWHRIWAEFHSAIRVWEMQYLM